MSSCLGEDQVDSVYSLLLIEDDEQLAEVTSAYLELEGFLVVKAHNVTVSWNHITIGHLI